MFKIQPIAFGLLFNVSLQSQSCVSLVREILTKEMQLQHTATHCNALQHIATHCCDIYCNSKRCNCNTLQHTATYCNTQQRTAATYIASQCNFDQRDATASHCSTQQRTATHCNTLLQHILQLKEMQLQHTATHCNALQHIATPCCNIYCKSVQF